MSRRAVDPRKRRVPGSRLTALEDEVARQREARGMAEGLASHMRSQLEDARAQIDYAKRNLPSGTIALQARALRGVKLKHGQTSVVAPTDTDLSRPPGRWMSFEKFTAVKLDALIDKVSIDWGTDELHAEVALGDRHVYAISVNGLRRMTPQDREAVLREHISKQLARALAEAVGR